IASALVAGALVRLLCACIGVGFHARDDYFHVLEPALHWLRDPTFDWQHSDVSGAGYRSHLLPRLVWLALTALTGLGVTEPETQLRGLYALCGLYSLLTLPGMARLAGDAFGARAGVLAAWLGALFFAMPYAGTHLLIEAMAMPPLVWGLALVPSRAWGQRVAAGMLLGLACWWRLQVASAVVGLGALLLWRLREPSRRAETLSTGAALALGGVACFLVQGGFDAWTTGFFFGPLLENLRINLNPDPGLSRSGPLAFLGLWLALTVPPTTLWLAPGLWRAARQAPHVAWPFAAFVAIHLAVPHKEDRFMLPVLPLFLVGGAAAVGWLEAGEVAGPPWLRRTWPRARAYAATVLAVALALVVTNQSQANNRDVMRSLRADAGVRGIVSVGPELQAYFLGRPEVPTWEAKHVDEAWLRAVLDEARARGVVPNRVVAFARDRDAVEIALALEGFTCDPPQPVPGWWLDRLIYATNPRRNLRRSALLLYRCEQPALAHSGQTISGAG
ncbi:MAG TPA: hypothetical protein VFH51_18935, partial [Myxococcota bacterium]|nr:hypothetical protein [Myxococcota bacterium]